MNLQSMEQLPGLILGGLLLLLVVVLGFPMIRNRRQVNATRHWRMTTGQVLFSTASVGATSSGRAVVYPHVVYTYEVNGRLYQSERLYPAGGVGGSPAMTTVARYPAGKQVTVYYNPDDPTEAVLERRAPANFWLLFSILLIVLSLGGALVLMYG
jgi:hypothetical protein